MKHLAEHTVPLEPFAPRENATSQGLLKIQLVVGPAFWNSPGPVTGNLE